MAVSPIDGQILVCDVGAVFEEVNEIVAGANYGWPPAEGMQNGQSSSIQIIRDPIFK
ncbi:MAG: hypothetical protein R3B47_19400 [Bacteroidia bacterium]